MSSRGFLQQAKQEIFSQPGQTAKQIVRKVLASGKVGSQAVDPENSFSATLSKHYQDIGVTRKKIDGAFRYFPLDGLPVDEPPASKVDSFQSPIALNENIVTITLPEGEDHLKFADALVTTGLCQTRNEALLLLMSKGIESIKRSIGQS